MNCELSKKQLRRLIRERKAAMAPEQMQEEADLVFQDIEQTDIFQNAHTILLYYSLPDELPTHRVVERWATMKEVYLPRVAGKDLEIVRYDGHLDDNNSFHVPEPVGPAVDIVPDIIIVPGMAFDTEGHRLGRGGGFYDRLLSRMHTFTIGVALNCQICHDIPCEPHDCTMHMVMTSNPR